MSDFSLLSTDVGLWDTSTKATWGSLDFCPAVTWFQVHTIKQTQMIALSQAGAWEMQKSPTVYGICFDSAKSTQQVWVGLQPNSHVGASPPSSSTHSGGGGLEADIAGWWQPKLAICLHADEWSCGPCASD